MTGALRVPGGRAAGPSAAHRRLAAGTVIAGRFHLERRLGSGGMGEVWLARHAALDLLCAVKIIHAEVAASSALRARFELEARAAARIRSAHVVRILDSGVSEGMPYIAMEYLQGEDLRSRLARRRVLDARETADIIAQAACAVGRAHAAGLVHRDLKPANLFLAREDDREILKVLDFGVAKRLGGDGLTRIGELLGTPSYMSPEQVIESREVDHRSDLWALGVIAFRCLTGQLPFTSRTLGDLLVQVATCPPPVPSRIAPVPVGFDTWWARAVSRDPDRRFQSAQELADALRAALGLPDTSDGEPRARTTTPLAEPGSPAPPPAATASPGPALSSPPARTVAARATHAPFPLVTRARRGARLAAAVGPRAWAGVIVALLVLNGLIARSLLREASVSVTLAQAASTAQPAPPSDGAPTATSPTVSPPSAPSATATAAAARAYGPVRPPASVEKADPPGKW